MREIEERARLDRTPVVQAVGLSGSQLFADLRRLEAFYNRVEAALAHTAPPEGYSGIWVDYGNGVEADPYSWLRVLVAEALADCRRI